MFAFITKARIDSEGQLLPPVKAKGIKWAIASAIALIAAAVFAAGIISSITIAAILFASGTGAGLGVLQLASAALSVGLCVEMCLIAKECILNAKHHMQKPAAANLEGRAVVLESAV